MTTEAVEWRDSGSPDVLREIGVVEAGDVLVEATVPGTIVAGKFQPTDAAHPFPVKVV